MSAISTIFTAGIGRIFVKNFGLSPFTIPFILSVWIWVAGAYKFSYFPINGIILSPAI
jgi:urea transporter